MAGIPRGVRNNNPGNVRFKDQRNAINVDGFAKWPTYEEGVAGMDRQLLLYYTGQSAAAGNVAKTTIADIIETYAPASENNVPAYIATVASRTGIDPNAQLTPEQLPAIRDAMIYHEIGMTREEGAQLATGYYGIEEPGTGPAEEAPVQGPPAPGTDAPPEATPSGSSESTEPVTINWVPNPLSDLENPAYYIRFFLIDEISEKELYNIDPTATKVESIPKIIFAESGATGINIESLEITTVLSPNQYTKLVHAQEFKMKLFEPMGFTLFDRLMAAGRDMAIFNIQKAPFYIEVKFHGYDQNGNYIDNVGSPPLNPKKWLYRVAITDIQSEFTASGSIYELTLVQYNDLGTLEAHFSLDASFNPNGSTIGEVINKLIETKINSDLAQYGYVRNDYAVIMKPLTTDMADINLAGINSLDPLTWRISIEQPAQPNTTGSTQADGPKESAFSKGQNIASIIEQLFAATKEGQILTRRNKEGAEPAADCEYIITPWIIPDVKIKENPMYDPIVKDYNRVITYHVHPFLTTRGVASPKQAEPLEKRDADEMKKKLDIRVKAGKLEKRYDYLFTGLNTEILDLRLNFDMLYKAIIPHYLGNTNIGMHRSGATFQAEFNRQVEIRRQAYNKVQENNNEIARLNRSLEEAQRGNDERAQQSIERRLGVLEQETVAQQQIVNQVDQTIGGARIAASNEIKQGLIGRKTQNITGSIYVEDFPFARTDTFPIVTIDRSVREGGQENRGNIEANEPLKQSMTTAILNQMKEPSMIEIVFTIRGDPYWLGNTHLEQDYFKHEPAPNSGTATYNSGDMGFLLKFFIPKGVNEEGEVEIKPEETFNGIYFIKTIKHQLNKGSFIQVIEAIRDINIDINLIENL